MSKQVKKPRETIFYDGTARCHTEEPAWNEAFCVEVDCPSLYEAKEVRKLINWLERSEKWMKNKELYKKRGRKQKDMQ